MKKCELRYGLVKAMIISVCVLSWTAGLFSCDSDRLSETQRKGSLSLSLSADTTGIRGGTLTTKAIGEFDSFQEVENYAIRIIQEEDTLESFLYRDFPNELAVKEGNYTLKAFKGENIPAAFDNPYFEGSREFTIKEGMKTPLEVTCTMANARVKTEYSEDFLKAYTNYTVMLKTSYLDSPFLISKEETRYAYLETDRDGTALNVAISLKRDGWTEAKVYTVTNPAITILPKESITLKFTTDGKTGDGLALSVVLDDTMEEVELNDTIPDFMWKPFDKPTLKAQDFESGDHVAVSGDGLDVPPYLAFGVPSGIGSFHIWQTIAGSEDTVKYDIANSAGAAAAVNAGFDWGGSSLFNYKKNAALQLEEAFKRLPYIGEDKEYEFIFFIKDNLPVTNYTDTVRLFVKRFYASPKIKPETEWPVNGVVEGESLNQDLVVKLEAEGGIKEVTVSLKDAVGEETKYTTEQLAAFGAELVLSDADTKGVLTISKEFTQKLNALSDSDQSYELSITVDAKEGSESLMSTTLTNTILVKIPVFEFVMAENEGDVFAKRAILRADVKVGLSTKLKFQKKEGDSWVDVSADARVKEGTVVIDTLKGLTPSANYMVRAVYENERNRNQEFSFVTEDAKMLENGGMDNWEEDWNKSLYSGADVFLWSKKYTVTANQPKGWSTVNDKTFGGSPNVLSTWNLRPSTVKTSGKEGNGVLLRSVGWDNGSGNSYKVLGLATVIKHFSVGKLFLGDYSYNHKNNEETYDYGIPFTSRPSGVKFAYKYVSYGEDNSFKIRAVAEHREGDSSIRIGYSEYIGTMVTNSYVDESFEIKYDSKYMNLKATHFYLEFLSSSKYEDIGGSLSENANDYLDKYFGHHNNTYKYFEGSQLYIDDVELIYE